MPANTQPIYPKTPNIGFSTADGDGGTLGPIKTANTAKDGTGTVNTVFTAGASGSYVSKLTARPAGTNIASVLRVFLNNGSSSATKSNNVLIGELFLPAVTLNEAQQFPDLVLPINKAIPLGYKLLVVIGTTIAAGIYVVVDGGDY